MREPKFEDAWCFGKEFQANSKICRVCLANKQCQKKLYQSLGVTSARPAPLLGPPLGSRRGNLNLRQPITPAKAPDDNGEPQGMLGSK